MGKERRRFPRIKVNLPARWEGVVSREEGTITSLSENGCFVLTAGSVQRKELIWLEINLQQSQVEPISLWAEVVDEAYEIGYAVRFTSSSDEDQARLVNFLAERLRSITG